MTIDAVVERKVERVAEGKNLLANLNLIDAATWETSQEVSEAWQKGIPDKGVNTANLGVYRLKGGEAVFQLFGREGNPFMDKTMRDGIYNGIWQNRFFFPQGAMKDKIKSAKPLVTVRYSGLRGLKTDNCGIDYGYVEFEGKNTYGEKKLFNAVYGTDNSGNGKRVYLLREKVVKAQLKSNPDDLIVRACYFYYGQNFLADDRYVRNNGGAVRGVRLKNVAEGDEPENVL